MMLVINLDKKLQEEHLNLTFGNHEAWTKEVTSKLPVSITSSTV